MAPVFVDVEVNESFAGAAAGWSHGPGVAALEASSNRHGDLPPSRRKARLPYLVLLNICLLFVDSFCHQATVEGGGEAAAYRMSSAWILGTVTELRSQCVRPLRARTNSVGPAPRFTTVRALELMAAPHEDTAPEGGREEVPAVFIDCAFWGDLTHVSQILKCG